MLRLQVSINTALFYDIHVINDGKGHEHTADYDVEVYEGVGQLDKQPVFKGRVEGFNRHEKMFALTECVMALVKENVKP